MITAHLSDRLPEVSKLAVGSLTVSKMQAALPADEAAAVLAYAFDSGINFTDTAQYYEITTSSVLHCNAAADRRTLLSPQKPTRIPVNSPWKRSRRRAVRWTAT